MNSFAAIDARLTAVSELVQSEETFTAVRDALKGVQKVDLDKLIVQLAAMDRRAEVVENTVKSAYDRMGQLLDLQKIIRNIPSLGRATVDCGSTLLRAIGDVCTTHSSTRYSDNFYAQLVSDPSLKVIEGRIHEDLNEYSAGSKKVVQFSCRA